MAPEQPVSETAKSAKPKFDAPAYLERTLPRTPGDHVKVFPMHGRNSYRVNWYNVAASQKATMPGLRTTYIRESKFLYCSLSAEGVPEITYPARQ
jgi:hypothetical protein